MSNNNGDKKLFKAGELAKRFGILASTIRYYTTIGLLKADARSRGGYNLYDLRNAGKILENINDLKKKRWTLEEIKRELVK
jgi:DNA-binding transcriptional MerR regulator